MIGQKKRLTASAARRKHSVTAAIFDCCTLICRIGEKLAVYPSQMPRVLLARCSVLYLLAQLTGEAGASLSRPACTGRKTGGVFVSGSEQKACPFSGSGGRYTSPRPSSPVSKRTSNRGAFPPTPGGMNTAPGTQNQRRRASTLGACPP